MQLRVVVQLTLVEAVRSLSRNLVRSGLAMLGIAVAVAIVITVIALGRAAIQSAEEELDKLGNNLVWVEAGSRTVSGARTGSHGTTTLTVRDAEAIRELPLIKEVSENVDGNFLVIYEGRNWRARWRGVAPSYRTIRRWDMARGAFFDDVHVEQAARVVVIGETVRRELFGSIDPTGEDPRPAGGAVGGPTPRDLASPIDPIGQRVRINNIDFEVIGLLARKGESTTGQDQDDTVMMPWTTAMKRIVGKDQTWLEDIMCSAISTDAVKPAITQVSELLRQRHHIEPGEPDDFNIRHPEEVVHARIRMTNTLRMLLLLLASIAMAVGGIGVMNVMLASVSQRVAEIGLRCAVGARPSAIQLQFLGEAVVLSLLGGVAGVVLGELSASLFEGQLGWRLAMSPGISVIAVISSIAVGVAFGLYPAVRAARVDPIVALRTE
jgi:putative ABC transport system permease protein